jgi:Fe-S cluster assembly protein SufD
MEVLDRQSASQVNWDLSGKFVLNASSRKRALEHLENTDFPTTRTEAWKYTRVAKIKNTTFKNATQHTISGDFGLSESSLKYVFVNGHFAQELSSKGYPEGTKIQAISKMEQAEQQVFGSDEENFKSVFHAFNTAYATDGLYVHVSSKVHVEQTIEIIHIQTGENIVGHLRHAIAAEAFSSAHIIQRFLSVDAKGCFSNVISNVQVGKNANLTINKIQEEDASSFAIISENVEQNADSTFTINTITIDGGLVRNDLSIAVAGSNSTTNLNGAYLLKGIQHVDNHTTVDHLVAHCDSNELYKGVIDDKATAVFNGKVFVRPNAQKINAFQSNGNVLMSDDATINSKPELEIYADDVKCSHGSTTGQLDDEAIFYLRARGIGEKAARQLMVSAFIGEVLEKIEDEAVLEHIHLGLEKRFGWVIA